MTVADAGFCNALADRCMIGRDVGAGGKATVYEADDIKHLRKARLSR